MKRSRRQPPRAAGSADPAFAELRRALGSPAPPRTITQRAFDYDPSHYQRLCSLAPGERPRPMDLVDCCNDMQYQPDLQRDLFRFLLPVCLWAWRETLSGELTYVGCADNLFPALLRGKIIERLLDAREGDAVAAFIRSAILSIIDQQRGLHFDGRERSAHRWVAAFTTYGVLFPDLATLWKTWWETDSVGSTVASLQYLSCLMYAETENPVFDAWTPLLGGGPPPLWEYQGHLYQDRWLPPNVAFLAQTLDAALVEARLVLGRERLAGRPEHAMACRLVEDLPLVRSTVERRCAELPALLSIPSEPEATRAWPP